MVLQIWSRFELQQVSSYYNAEDVFESRQMFRCCSSWQIQKIKQPQVNISTLELVVNAQELLVTIWELLVTIGIGATSAYRRLKHPPASIKAGSKSSLDGCAT